MMFSLSISFNYQRGYFQYLRHFHACCNVTPAIYMAQRSKTKTEKTLQRKQNSMLTYEITIFRQL